MSGEPPQRNRAQKRYRGPERGDEKESQRRCWLGAEVRDAEVSGQQ